MCQRVKIFIPTKAVSDDASKVKHDVGVILKFDTMLGFAFGCIVWIAILRRIAYRWFFAYRGILRRLLDGRAPLSGRWLDRMLSRGQKLLIAGVVRIMRLV